jgi:hypothetical protein
MLPRVSGLRTFAVQSDSVAGIPLKGNSPVTKEHISAISAVLSLFLVLFAQHFLSLF